ncbi:MAG: hypothetical protein CBC67_03295 [Gammaproteobacteria bacterium TMED107]|nr:hypothetical protein [Gammaproteobacteria bacterium]OUX76201.1 MAG: hypothetical protein CBC67_03295 [Gammaproteobacteria bacterium TMED107]
MENIDKKDHSVLRQAAMDFLARREHSLHELKTKLIGKFPEVSPTLVLAVLSRLTAEGLQSDERYTESRIRYRLERGFGYHHIRNDLISKGVDPFRVDQMLYADDDCWLQKARELIEKRLIPTTGARRRVLAYAGPEHRKLARFLEARGFSQRDIKFALDVVIAP